MDAGDAILRHSGDLRAIVCELCRRMHARGWATGTGGGVSIREPAAEGAAQGARAARIFVAPSGVPKELLAPEDLFTIDLEGSVVSRPRDRALSLSACTPLFLHAYRMRDAGAVLHSHSMNAMLASAMVVGRELRATEIEMMKGIAGHGLHDELVVPILENTAHERDLADALASAILAYPRTHAVLVRRHGVYVWGRDWQTARTHAECYDYVFEAYVRMRALGIDPAAPRRAETRHESGRPPRPDRAGEKADKADKADKGDRK